MSEIWAVDSPCTLHWCICPASRLGSACRRWQQGNVLCRSCSPQPDSSKHMVSLHLRNTPSLLSNSWCHSLEHQWDFLSGYWWFPRSLRTPLHPRSVLRGGHDLCHKISWKSIRNNRVSRLTSALISNSQTAFLATVSSQGSQTGPMVFFYAFVDINNPVKALEHKRGITHSGIWTFCLTSLLHRHGERLI